MEENRRQDEMNPQGSQNENDTADVPAENTENKPEETNTPVKEVEANTPVEEAATDAPAEEIVGTQQESEQIEAAKTVKKNNKTLFLVIAVLLVLVIAGIAAFAGGLFDSPEKSVKKAVVATYRAQMEQMQAMSKEIPAMQLLWEEYYGDEKSLASGKIPSTTDFQASFKSFESGSPNEDAMVNQLLGGLGVKGSFTSDPGSNAAEIEGAIQFGGMDLLELYGFASPELAAFSVPTFTDTVVSMNPKTFAEDAKASKLNECLGMSDEDLNMMQTLINSQVESMLAIGDLDIKKLNKDICAILVKSLENAVYEKGEKSNGLQAYRISIPGADVKAGSLEMFRYIYLDSPISAVYKNAFSPIMLDGKTYEEFINDEILSILERGMPEPDLAVTLRVGKQGMISEVSIAVEQMTASVDSPSVFETFTMDYKLLDENLNEQVKMNMGFIQDGRPVAVVMDVKAVYSDGAYNIDVVLDVVDTETNSAITKVTETIKMDKNGGASLSLGMDVPGFDGSVVKVMMDVAGTIKIDAEKIVYDYPDISGMVEMGSEKVALNFAAKAETVKAASPHTISKEHKPLAEMSEEEITTLMQQYQAGSELMMNTLFSMLFGM